MLISYKGFVDSLTSGAPASGPLLVTVSQTFSRTLLGTVSEEISGRLVYESLL